MLTAWRLALHTAGAVGPLPIWVAIDGRGGEVPADIVGNLTSYRVWDTVDGSDFETVTNAAEWLESAQHDSRAWDPVRAPSRLPRFAFASVPEELVLETPAGRAVLSPPSPAPFAAGMMLATSVSTNKVDLRLWYDTGSFAAADVTELLASVGRIVAGLQNSASTPQRTRGIRTTEPNTAIGKRGMYRSLFERVADRAAEHPDAPAITLGDESVTYGDLIAAARVVAHAVGLQRNGIDECVGVLLPQGPALVAALLGINAAGAAYVPLDYTLPAARIETMLRTTGVRRVVCDADARPLIPSDISIIQTCSADVDASFVHLHADDDPDALAYVLFTSGSTGTPKGVLVTRGGLDSYLTSALERYPFDRGSAVVTHSPPIFDLAITSLLAPLIAGMEVVVTPSGTGLEGLVATLRSVCAVSLLKLTPTHLAALDQLLGPHSGVRVYTAVVGGEDLATEVAAQWIEHHPECRIFNEYGPTETVVGCTVGEFGTDDLAWPTVAVGHQFGGAAATVRGPDLRPLEAGVTGELFIGGRTVARGYAGDPRRTAEMFLPDPGGAPGARMYRSGDLAVATASRGLRYLGRADRQLKIRGFRVEPAEVETHLRGLPGVAEAIVRSAPVSGGDAILVAYVVIDEPISEFSTAAVRAALRAYLPDYLLPDAVIRLDALPITANGKVDETRLPDYRTSKNRPTYGKRTDTENLVASSWTEVLGSVVEDVDARFFEIGGTSFSLVKVVARLSAAVGVELSITDLFDRATVRGMAALIDEKHGDRRASSEPRPNPGNDRVQSLHRLRLAREGVR